MGDIGSALSGAVSGIGGLFGGGSSGGGSGGGSGFGGGGGSSPFDGSGFGGISDIFSNLPNDVFNQDPTTAQAMAIQGPPNQPDPTSAGGGTTSGTTASSGGQTDSADPNAPFKNILRNTMAGRGPSAAPPSPAADSTAKAFSTGAGTGGDSGASSIQLSSGGKPISVTDKTGPAGGASGAWDSAPEPAGGTTGSWENQPARPVTPTPATAYPNIPIGGGAGNVMEAPTGTPAPAIPIGGGAGNVMEAPTGAPAADKPAPGATTAIATAPATGADGAVQTQPGGYGGQGQFDPGNLFRSILPMIMMAAMGGMGRGGMGAMLPMMMMGLLGGGQGGMPGMFRGGWLGRGYYPNGRGGMAFHPGGYHPGWGPGRNWAAGRYGGGGPVSLSGGGNWSGAGADGVQRQGSVRNLGQYINDRARAIGVDPALAVGIASAEGLNANTVSRGGNADARGTTAYGPFQLNTSGLAQNFQRDTGLNPADPSTQFAQVDWTLNFIKNNPGALGNWMSIKDQGGLDNIRARGRRYIAGLGQGAGTTAPASNYAGPDRGDLAGKGPMTASDRPARMASVSQFLSGDRPPSRGGDLASADPNAPGYRDMPTSKNIEDRRGQAPPPGAISPHPGSYPLGAEFVSPQGRAWAARHMPAVAPTGYLPDPTRSPFIHQGNPQQGYWAQNADGTVTHYPGTDYAPAAPMGIQ